MTEAYVVASRLTLTNDVNRVLAQIIEEFENLDKTITGAQERLATFGTDIRSLSAAGSELRSLMGSFSSAKLNGSLLNDLKAASELSSNIASSQSSMRTAATETAAAWKEIAGASARIKLPSPPSAGSGSGGGGRNGGGSGGIGSSGGNSLFGSSEDRANAVWMNQDFDARTRTASRREADAAKAEAAGRRFDSDYQNALHEDQHYSVFGTPEQRRDADLENRFFDAQERAARAAERVAAAEEKRAKAEEKAAERSSFDAAWNDARYERENEKHKADRAHEAIFGTDEERRNASLMNADFDARRRAQERQAREGKMSHFELGHAAVGLQMGGDVGTSFFERALGADFEFEHQFATLTGDTRLTEQQQAEIRKQIAQVTRDTKVLNRSETLEVFSDLKTVFGDTDEARAELPTFAKMVATLKMAVVRKGGEGDIGQALKLARFIEDQGGAIDAAHPDRYNQQRFDEIAKQATKVYSGTKGRMSPSEFFSFQKSGRSGDMTLNDHALFEETPYFAMSLGPSRFGTALFSDFQTLLAGRMDAPRERWMEDLGLIRKGSGHYVGTGPGKHFEYDPKDLKDRDTAKSDIYKWLAETLAPAVAKKYHFDPTTEDGREEMVLQLTHGAQRSTIAGMWADVVRNYGPAQKEGRNIAAQNDDMMGHMLQTDPMAQVLVFRAAENEFMVTLGDLVKGPAVEYLKQFTAGLHGVVDWMNEHPDGAKQIAEAAATIAILSKVLGGLAMGAFFLGPVLSLFRSFTALLAPAAAAAAPFAEGGAAAAGLSGLTMGLNGLVARIAAVMGVLAVGSSHETAMIQAAREQNRRNLGSGLSPITLTPQDGFGVDGQPLTRPPAEAIVSPGSSGQRAPVPVVVTNQLTSQAIMNGVTGNLSNRMNRPPSGYTGSDPRMDPLAPYYDMVGVGP